MKKQVFLMVMTAVTVFFATPSRAGFFDPFVHPTPPYGMDKLCDDQTDLCRNFMVYDDGAAPNENVRGNYFYDNPNRDWTIAPQRNPSYKSAPPHKRRR